MGAHAELAAIEVWREGWSAGIQPRARITVSEWADAKRVLPGKASSLPGQWRTSKTPYAREIMDCLSDHHPAREVVVMAAIQMIKTEVLLNWIGYTIDHAPSSMLVVQPTVDVGDRFSKQRLAPTIEDSPALKKKIAPARSRDSGNTTTSKEFDDGILLITGANSAAGLASMPIKKLGLDEIDRFPVEIDEEGDPIDIAEGRCSNFPEHKIYKCSSPTIESLSRIHKAWKRSDQRRYFVPCPECGEKQYLKWDNLNYSPEAPQDARYACEHCGVLIDENRKTGMLAAGEWRATYPERSVPGFHINALYSPHGLGKSWGWLAERYEEVKNDPPRFKVFVNTRLGECYEDPDEKLDWEEIKARAEPYKQRQIPRGALVLTCGVDVQKDRLEAQVIGWGRGEQAWVIDVIVLPGDPTSAQVWLDLDEYLAKPFTNSCGVSMRIISTAVDSGYLTDDVLNYTRFRKNRGVFAIKGSNQRGRQILGRPSKVDVTIKGATIKGGAELWMLGVDSAKHRLFARLAADRKQAMASARMVHFSDELPEDYYMQLTAEIWDPNKGRWIKQSNRRNEALDTFNYAMAAAMHPRLRVHVAREHDWAKLEEVIEPKGRDMFLNTPPPEAVATPPVQTSAPAGGGQDKAADAGAEQPAATDAAATEKQRPPPRPAAVPERPAVRGPFHLRQRRVRRASQD